MAIEDYLPNVFGSSAPSYLQGLLGAEETQKLQGRANVQGLLGAGLALAQGMSRTGPRRSAAENILGALAGGFGAAGGAYDQGVKNYVTQQQIAQTQLAQQKALIERQQYMAQQGAVENLLKSPEIANDPLKVAYIRANPNEALKLYSELLPLQRAGQPTLAVPQTQPASATMPAQLGGQTQPAVTQPAPVMDGQEKPLPPVETAAKPSLYNQRIAEKQGIENTIRIYSDPQFAGNERAGKIVDQSLKRLEAINKEITKVSVADLSGDLQSFRNSAPPQFQGQIDNLINIASTGEISPDQLSQRTNDISKQINDYRQKETDFTRAQNDYTKEAYRVGQQVAPGVDPSQYTPAQIAEIQRRLVKQEKDLRIAGRTLVTQTVYGDKEFIKRRIEGAVNAEEQAMGAINVANDVRAIVDVLKPYQGGKLDEFKATVGSYLPDTSMAQIATANDLAVAIRARIAPTLRVPGSGATSDFETKQFLAALPSLMQYSNGRDLIATYTEKLANRAVAAADLRSKMIEDGTYSVKNFQQSMKDQGLDRVFTDAEIAQLRSGKAPSGGSTLPADVKKKYGIQD
jgi:hypothetical protein